MLDLTVVKIGGNVVDNPEALELFLKDFAALPSPKVLVHGGGKIATTISKALGIEAQMIGGRRVTDGETIKVVTQVYAGLINKKIVAALRSEGVDAFGLCGADGGMIISQRRSPEPIDFGFVGDPIVEQFNVEGFARLMDSGYSVVVAPITISQEGELLNTNADTVAQTIAVAMSAKYNVSLIYCFEKDGVLLDINDASSLVEEINPSYFEMLKAEGVVADGMLPKLENAFKAISKGVERVIIKSSKNLNNSRGTVLIAE